MNENKNLESALADVRTAYRLLWAYQQRALDVVRTMVSHFDDLSFYYWDSNRNGRPGGGWRDPSSDPSWSLLPTADISLLYLSAGADPNLPKAGDWMLECRLWSDTEIDAGLPADFRLELTAASEAARSLLKLYAWRCVENVKLNWYRDLWRNTAWPSSDDKFEPIDRGFEVVSKTFDLTDLGDEFAILNAANMFKSFLEGQLRGR